VTEEDASEEKNPSWGGGEEETHLGRLPTTSCGGCKGDANEEKNPSWGGGEEETHLGRLPATPCSSCKGN
jgi:hypothetical protein